MTKISDGKPVLYQKGEVFVTVIDVKDEQVIGIGSRRMFAIVHEPTGVLMGTTPMLSGAIRSAYALNEDIKDALAKPNEVYDDLKAAGSGPAGLNTRDFQFS